MTEVLVQTQKGPPPYLSALVPCRAPMPRSYSEFRFSFFKVHIYIYIYFFFFAYLFYASVSLTLLVFNVWAVFPFGYISHSSFRYLYLLMTI